MERRIKDFAALKSLKKELEARDEARRREEAERAARVAREQQEANVFRSSVGEVAPLSKRGRASSRPAPPPPHARQREADEQAALAASLSDEFSLDALLEVDEALSYTRPGIGSDVVGKLRRGHWVVQSQLDLHGMRREEAREALAEYLRNAIKRGNRCVRIIHGKGLGSVNREPVLKNKVRNWLVQKDEVMAFCEARAIDGGSGAVLVLLKG
jgi:DNA-nicking Smr family endonuclease